MPKDLRDRFTPYREDSVAFAQEVLGVEQLPAYQAAILEDVAEHERVAWVAGHPVGKSHAAAILLAWHLITRPGCRCRVTSATFERQVGRVVFAKLRTMLARSKEELPIDVSLTRAQVAGLDEWSAEGVPANRPDNFAGFHADRMLVVADEAKALDRPVFEELHGVLASARWEARLLMLSTADPAEGYFYEAFTRRSELWETHWTPSTDSPFAEGFAERMREVMLGEEDPLYRMRVLAEFAEDVEGSLLPISRIHAAVGRECEAPAQEEDVGTALGVDVARFGEDRTVLAVREGRRLVELKAWRGGDLMTTAERVASELNARGARALVDVVGMGGGLVDRLRQLGHEKVESVNVAEASGSPETFTNRRAELGWRLRERFERGEVAIPDDAQLVSELAELRYEYDSRGRIKLEAKDAAKARLGRSPDLADAVMLAFGGRATGSREVGTWGSGRVGGGSRHRVGDSWTEELRG